MLQWFAYIELTLFESYFSVFVLLYALCPSYVLIVQFFVLLGEDVAVEVAVLLLVAESLHIRRTLHGISKGCFGIGFRSGELGALRLLRRRRLFGGWITHLAGEHFAVAAEEIDVGVATQFATHGLNESHWFDCTHLI